MRQLRSGAPYPDPIGENRIRGMIAKSNERAQNRVNPDCVFFNRLGVCPYGGLCPCYHISTAFPRVLILHHIYPNPDVFYRLIGESCSKDNEEKQRLFDAFYYDIYLECRQFGEVLDILVSGNSTSYLYGNVWVCFDESDAAVAACLNMNGRYYAGRKIKATLWDCQRLSSLICNPPYKQCDRGEMCCFVHPIEPSNLLRAKCFNRNSRSYPSKYYEENRIFAAPDEIMINGVEKIVGSSDK